MAHSIDILSHSSTQSHNPTNKHQGLNYCKKFIILHKVITFFSLTKTIAILNRIYCTILPALLCFGRLNKKTPLPLLPIISSSQLTRSSPSSPSLSFLSLSSAGICTYENVHHFDDSRDYRRLLVQLEETERRFDEFWNMHLIRLKQCLELRRFEQDFRELQVINFIIINQGINY